jgi:mono/diheme cytochrome c family protein
MHRTGLLVLAVVAAIAGCRSRDAAPAAEPSSADTVAVAQAAFDPAVFDTIHWPDEAARLARGGDVFRWGCAECHGPQGHGDGAHVTERGDTLRPPDFADPSWRLAADTETVRRRIFTGNMQGMPHWGLRRMEARDIDAVTDYVLTVLHNRR